MFQAIGKVSILGEIGAVSAAIMTVPASSALNRVLRRLPT